MNLLNPVLSFLFPVFCANCPRLVENISDGPACRACWAETRLFNGTETTCHKCGAFHNWKESDAVTYCRRCDDDYFDLARACGPYEHALRTTVLELKNTPRLAKRPADLLFDCYAREPFRAIDLIVPVPLSKRRRLERGFNQSELLAHALSKRSGIPVDTASLLRAKHTMTSRAAMDRKGRAITVKNAFAVRRQSLIHARSILLIDDVFTSGATASMAAKALKKNGAGRVDVLTLARAKSLN